VCVRADVQGDFVDDHRWAGLGVILERDLRELEEGASKGIEWFGRAKFDRSGFYSLIDNDLLAIPTIASFEYNDL
jgi:hypothetical protein